MLYDLPHLQLGSSDDVLTDAVYEQLLCPNPVSSGIRCIPCVGAVRHDVPGTVLGALQ